jgi:hypothetical protein
LWATADKAGLGLISISKESLKYMFRNQGDDVTDTHFLKGVRNLLPQEVLVSPQTTEVPLSSH